MLAWVCLWLGCYLLLILMACWLFLILLGLVMLLPPSWWSSPAPALVLLAGRSRFLWSWAWSLGWMCRRRTGALHPLPCGCVALISWMCMWQHMYLQWVCCVPVWPPSGFLAGELPLPGLVLSWWFHFLLNAKWIMWDYLWCCAEVRLLRWTDTNLDPNHPMMQLAVQLTARVRVEY